jgi:protease-4
MRSSRVLTTGLALIPLAGCHNFVVRTQNRVALDGPIVTKVSADIPPVSPEAGKVVPVVVRAGQTEQRVAILDLDGLLLNTPFVGPMSLGENPVALFREKLDAAEADPLTHSVVLRVNSFGGGVAAAQTMRRDLERFRARSSKPVVACLMDTAAGGAYHVASAADRVIASPTTITGGLGVILNLFNLRDLMAQFNILPQPVKSGENVDLGSSARALSDEDKKRLQSIANELHAQLIADVRRSRPQVGDAAAEPFDGRIYTGTQAFQRGLVDQLGDLDTAIDLAAQLGLPAGCAPTPSRAEAVLYRRANDPAHSVYAVTPNMPLQGTGILPNVPGLDRSKLPTFLSLWQPESTMEKLSGK